MGYVKLDTIIEEAGTEKVEIKNDYISVEEMVPVELVIKKSRFIGMAFHVKDENEAHQIVGNVRKSNKNAAHVCYAYALGETVTVAKNNDDGEPAGSAGAPIFEAIKQSHLTFILVVVVRYFGGIKLGAGGLVRAYSKTAGSLFN